MQLYTRYQPTQNRPRPWRLLFTLLVLVGALVWWLNWEPEQEIEPQSLVGAGLQLPTNPYISRLSDEPPGSGVTNIPPTTNQSSVTASPTQTTNHPNAQMGSTPSPLARLEGHPVQDTFEVQLALSRLGLCPGSIDGVTGSRTRNALEAFQKKRGLKVTGQLDDESRSQLRMETPSYTYYVVTATDLERLLPVGKSWLQKSYQPRLDYETILELVAEKHRSHPDFIRQKNPTITWDYVPAGTRILVPHIPAERIGRPAAFARIQLANRVLQVFDDQVRLLAHYPCSIARSIGNRPVGTLRVESIVRNPDYAFDPERFPDSPEATVPGTRLRIPPGPNNPVGVAWIGLDKPGYGIHGTPYPEQVGRAESLGCFRLANWNADQFAGLAWVGMPVQVEP